MAGEFIVAGLLLISAGVITLLCVKAYEKGQQRQELAKKNMSFMESLNLTGLPIICFNNTGQTVNMVLDTGSNVSIIDINALDAIEHSFGKDSIEGIIGVSGEMGESSNVNISLTYKEMKFTFECYANDISATVNAVKQEYGVTIHGLLGTDFFTKYKYIIDFNEMVAYSLKKQ